MHIKYFEVSLTGLNEQQSFNKLRATKDELYTEYLNNVVLAVALGIVAVLSLVLYHVPLTITFALASLCCGGLALVKHLQVETVESQLSPFYSIQAAKARNISNTVFVSNGLPPR